MKVAYTPVAKADLRQLHDYIGRDSPVAARRMVALIREAIEQRLVDFPKMGRPGRVDGTRELSLAGTPYFIDYRLDQGQIDVLAVLHGRREWPESG